MYFSYGKDVNHGGRGHMRVGRILTSTPVAIWVTVIGCVILHGKKDFVDVIKVNH